MSLLPRRHQGRHRGSPYYKCGHCFGDDSRNDHFGEIHLLEKFGGRNRIFSARPYRSFGEVYTNLLNLPELTFRDRMITASLLSRIWRGMGNLLIMKEKRSEARGYFAKALLLMPC